MVHIKPTISTALGCFLLTFFSMHSLHAQTRAFFTTGGDFQGDSNMVRVYSYAPSSGTKRIEDSVLGDFSNAVLVDDTNAYAHIGRANDNSEGPDILYRYSRPGFGRVDSIDSIAGLQNMALYKEWLLVTRGFGANGAFFQAYEKGNLSQGPVFSSTEIPSAASGLTIMNDRAFVSYTRNDTGHIAAFDLTGSSPSFDTKWAMDTLSNGISELHNTGNAIIGLSEKFDPNTFELLYAGVTVLDPAAGSYQTDTNQTGATAGFMVRNDSLFADLGSPVNIYDLATNEMDGQLFTRPYTDATYDPMTNRYFFQNSDFFSFGNLVITNGAGEVLDSVGTDISGSAIALYQKSSTELQGPEVRTADLNIHPNPASERIFVELPNAVEGTYRIHDLSGRTVKKGTFRGTELRSLNIGSLSTGHYFIRIRTHKEQVHYKAPFVVK